MTSYADHMTIAQIIHDFATRQGDLTDRWVREDLAAILERRMASAWEAGWEACSNYLQDAECDPAYWDLFHVNPYRAEQIRTTETEGTK